MDKPKYLDKSLSFEQRAEALVSEMTLYEKASQTIHNSPAVPRLNIPAYNWWSEGLHGVARAGTATVFPQAIGLAATFNVDLFTNMAEIIAVEGRAKYYASKESGDRDIFKGLTYWSPNINIFRDPRWGRGQETYGEDPYLTTILGKAFVKGLQGDGKYLKLAACAKHFAVHSGPESLRHEFNAEVSQRDLWDTYLPAFEALVTETDVEAVMGAYNRTNGEPCCGSPTLLEDILRKKWGFKGHVTSDCWAIQDFHMHHNVTHTATESVALALKSGCDLNCGNLYLVMLLALQEGLITEEDINRSVVRLMTTRFKLGLFDENEEDIYKFPYEAVASREHLDAALQASRDSFVLLQNKNDILPLKTDKIKTIGVIGPNADSRDMLMGNYNGTPPRYITVLEGIYQQLADTPIRILHSEGCHLWKRKLHVLSIDQDRISEAIAVAKASDVVVLCLGLDWRIEGEQGDTGNEFMAGDKADLDFPKVQLELLEAVQKVGKPIILLSSTGSAMNFTKISEQVDAIVQIWYPGGEGGKAVAEMLFGGFSPCGKLPVTIYKDTADLPDFEDYSMENRTYRYMKEKAMYPFGFGLGYTNFTYEALSDLTKEANKDEQLTFTVKVKNSGKMQSKEIVQCYVKHLKNGESAAIVPNFELRGMCVVELNAGQEKEVSFTLSRKDFEYVNENGERVFQSGEFAIFIGGGQPDERTEELTGTRPIQFNAKIQ